MAEGFKNIADKMIATNNTKTDKIDPSNPKLLENKYWLAEFSERIGVKSEEFTSKPLVEKPNI